MERVPIFSPAFRVKPYTTAFGTETYIYRQMDLRRVSPYLDALSVASATADPRDNRGVPEAFKVELIT
jgi:hypothetical protein